MKSIIINKPREVKLQEIGAEDPGAEEVLLEIQYIGLCGSDLSTYRGLSPLVTFPRIPGHEVSAIVVQRGINVPGTLAVGDKVTVNPYTSCGACPACRAGRVNTCQFNQTLGVQRDGALRQYLKIHHTKVIKSTVLNLKEFALVEPLSVGYHATNRAQVTEVDTVLVLGCGMIGIGAIVASVRKGATVIAVDLDDAKLEFVKLFGVKHVINGAKTDVLQRVKEITNGDGADVCIEAVGAPATYVLAVEAAVFSGRVVYIGYAKAPIQFDTSLFVKKELTILGSRNAHMEFRPVVKMLEERNMPFEKLISQVYPLEETGVALDLWDRKPAEFIKILIDVKKI